MFQFHTFDIIESISNNDSPKDRFCRDLKTDSSVCESNKIPSLFFCVPCTSWPQYCFFLLLGFHFYGSDIFIVPMGTFSAEVATFGAMLYGLLYLQYV